MLQENWRHGTDWWGVTLNAVCCCHIKITGRILQQNSYCYLLQISLLFILMSVTVLEVSALPSRGFYWICNSTCVHTHYYSFNICVNLCIVVTQRKTVCCILSQWILHRFVFVGWHTVTRRHFPDALNADMRVIPQYIKRILWLYFNCKLSRSLTTQGWFVLDLKIMYIANRPGPAGANWEEQEAKLSLG